MSGFAEITWDDGTKLLISGAGCRTRRDPKAVRRMVEEAKAKRAAHAA